MSDRQQSVAWIMPILATIVAAIMLQRWWVQRGPVVEISFADASGLVADSPVVYRGTTVGRVINTTISEDLQSVVATARLETTAAGLARDGSQWWVVRPRISLSQVSGLETLMGPRYIQVAPGDGEPTFLFDGLDAPPLQLPGRDGRRFLLTAHVAGSLEPGMPVFHRGLRVGEILDVALSSNAAVVEIRIFVEAPWQRLVRTDSRFWNASGLSLDVGLGGIEFHSDSLLALLRGGVAFATPNRHGDVAPEEHDFEMADHAKSEWVKWAPKIDLEDTPQ